jgi:hypothetical protein
MLDSVQSIVYWTTITATNCGTWYGNRIAYADLLATCNANAPKEFDHPPPGAWIEARIGGCSGAASRHNANMIDGDDSLNGDADNV